MQFYEGYKNAGSQEKVMHILPIVKPETCFSVEHECNGSDKQFLKKHLHALRENNPIVALWIERFSKTSKDRVSAMICGLMVYRLLESQEEANFMNEYF